MSLSKDFHTITGFLCTNGQYSKRYHQLNASGVLSTKQKDLLLFSLLDHVEQLEQKEHSVKKELDEYFNDLVEQARSKVEDKKADSELPTVSPGLSWAELRAKGKELGVFKIGQTRAELEALITNAS